jgi:hypothetical protein
MSADVLHRSEPPAQAKAREQRLAKIQQFIEFIYGCHENLCMGADIGAVTCYVDVPKFDGYTTFCHNCLIKLDNITPALLS